MIQTIGIKKAITNLNEAHQKLKLVPATNPRFFTEWYEALPSLTDSQKSRLDQLRNRYRHYQVEGAITEGTVNLIMVSPWLELLGLFDSPYKVRGEKYIRFELADSELENGTTRLEGLIDVLVVQETLWLVVIESKRYGFSVMQALPQALAYMAATPSLDRPIFGLITTGEDFLFIKLDLTTRQYDLSDKLTLTTRRDNQLYTVTQIMKRLLDAASS
jgi:hypothetical protein